VVCKEIFKLYRSKTMYEKHNNNRNIYICTVFQKVELNCFCCIKF